MAFDAPIKRAKRWNVLIQQGSTFERELTFAGLNLDWLHFRGQIRREHDSGTALADYSFEVTLPSTLTIKLTADQTAALPADLLVHDIECFIPASGFVARILEGSVEVTPEVTR